MPPWQRRAILAYSSPASIAACSTSSATMAVAQRDAGRRLRRAIMAARTGGVDDGHG